MEGGSEPSLSIQTFCVYTTLGGGGVIRVLDNAQNSVVFFMASLAESCPYILVNKVSEEQIDCNFFSCVG